MTNTYLDELTKVLKADDRLINADGKLLKSRITELARKLDEGLFSLLLSNDKLKQFFFKKIDGALVFDQEKFLTFVHNEAFFEDSYTAFKKKIGLATSRDDYISERSEVVLNWPYKDCVLEGGQDKEDQKRDEVFWNETLGADQRDTLLSPKVLDGFKRYDKDGDHDVNELSEDDNFVIRGNNLLALHTLKKRYAGRVKLIYIDPPFNTGGDAFKYNDRFSHSAWLTFMQNRLRVAYDLLTPDGTMFVHIDHNEAHYLKVLCDEIFGRDKFINEIIWCYTGPGSPGMRQFNRKHDNIFWYSKGDQWTFNSDDIRVASEVHVGGFNNEMTSAVSGSYENKGKIPEDWWEFAVAARARVDGQKRTGYSTEKPHKLLDRIIKTASNPGDIVMDFFAGSGTTAWVAQRENRRFIAIEQLSETQEILKSRLETAGSFVYAYLKNDANIFIDKVKKAKDKNEVEGLLQTILASNFLSYRVDPKKFEGAEFVKLSLDQQKSLLIELVNKNKLYVNYHDIDDADYGIDETTKSLNQWMQSRD